MTWTRLDYAERDRRAPSYELIAGTAMRRRAVCGLRWADVELESAQPAITTEGVPAGFALAAADAVAAMIPRRARPRWQHCGLGTAFPAARLKAAAVDSGYANLEIRSPAGGSWFFPYQTGSLPARPAPPVTVNLRGKATVNCGNDPNGHPYSFYAWTLVHHKKPA
jgi:integrase